MPSKLTRLGLIEVALCQEGKNEEAVISIHKAGQRPTDKANPAGGSPGDIKKEGLMAGEAEKIAGLESSIAKMEGALQTAKSALETAQATNATLTADLAKTKKEADEAKAEVDGLKKAAEIAKSDEVITVDGVELRKSVVGEAMFKITKSQAERIELAEFAKAAEAGDMSLMPGATDDKAKVLKAVARIPDEAVRKSTEAMLKAGAAAMAQLTRASGAHLNSVEFGKASVQFDALVNKHMADHKVDISKATDAVMQTREGSDLFQKMENEKPRVA